MFSSSVVPLRKRDARFLAVETALLPHTHHHRHLPQDLKLLEFQSRAPLATWARLTSILQTLVLTTVTHSLTSIGIQAPAQPATALLGLWEAGTTITTTIICQGMRKQPLHLLLHHLDSLYNNCQNMNISIYKYSVHN